MSEIEKIYPTTKILKGRLEFIFSPVNSSILDSTVSKIAIHNFHLLKRNNIVTCSVTIYLSYELSSQGCGTELQKAED